MHEVLITYEIVFYRVVGIALTAERGYTLCPGFPTTGKNRRVS